MQCLTDCWIQTFIISRQKAQTPTRYIPAVFQKLYSEFEYKDGSNMDLKCMFNARISQCYLTNLYLMNLHSFKTYWDFIFGLCLCNKYILLLFDILFIKLANSRIFFLLEFCTRLSSSCQKSSNFLVFFSDLICIYYTKTICTILKQ